VTGAIAACVGGTGPVEHICDFWKAAAGAYFEAVAACLGSSYWAEAGPDPDHALLTIDLTKRGGPGPGIWIPQVLRPVGWPTLPGIDANDVNVTIDGNILTVDVYFGNVSQGAKNRTIVYQGVLEGHAPGNLPLESVVVTVVKPAFSA
jgi:hypothetical protein